MNSGEFDQVFEKLTDKPPLSWQKRLFDRIVPNEHSSCLSVIDLPTGLGKTMVMAIWLVARAWKLDVPTRLIYVVDRRTVVDQATELAERIVGNWTKKRVFPGDPPAISTLRGQRADKREWSRDPSRPAIIIGTVDLIGSALLFSGYRSSYKRRPLESGLLGQDSLLVLDEAHLSKPFEKLLRSISDFQKSHGNPMRVMHMSATSGNSNDSNPPFTLLFDVDGKLTGEDAQDDTIVERFGASKTLKTVESEKPADAIAIEADKLAREKPGSRIVVFLRTPKLVTDVRVALEKKNKEYPARIAQLTGTMRGLERDELVDTETPLGANDHERRVMQRFLVPDNDVSQGVCFLISTSAGEVGFDLNADHLVGDESPLDSWIQRLGRVNRRGKGNAIVIIIKEKEPTDKTEFDKARNATSRLLTDGMDVSPKAIAAFKKSLTSQQLDHASSPKPATVELTDILLDAWSMTSITTHMPGRPEVGPWLRGIDDELPQTTIAWRAELDLDGFADVDIDDIEEWFDTHRVLTHETLSVPTHVAAKWFADRWANLDDTLKAEVGKRSIVVDQSGLKLVTVKTLIDQLGRKNADSIRYADLILPASFGGIERGVGLLDAEAPTNPADEKNDDEQTRRANAKARLVAPDLADVRLADVRDRYRETVVKPEGGEAESTSLVPGAAKPAKYARFALELTSDDEQTVRLLSCIPRSEKPETGQKPQTLKQHVFAVRSAVDNILSCMTLPDAIRQAAQLAADWHDHGKNRERWQRLLVFPKGFTKPDEPMGKSGGEMKRDPRGYRHEFGSLREFIDAHREVKFTDSTGREITKEVTDLALHLIAVHHGRGRPHFPKGGFDPDDESRSDAVHTESIRRFAHLQRKYGWWHLAWLENLLRCADALASADQDAEDDPTDAEGAEQ